MVDEPTSPVRRRTLTIALPSTLDFIIAGVVIAVLAGGAGTIYLKGRTDGYADGYAKAAAVYQAKMDAEAKANAAALDAANKQIIEIADQADRDEAALEAQLAELEASSGGSGATDLGLDAARMRALGRIR